MKTKIAIIIICLVSCAGCLAMTGCTQIMGPEKETVYYKDRIVVTEKAGKINTLFKSIGFDDLQ
ncbi:MAG: hypothetical protein FVQ79_11810, partial [Planctomycetes bacterium]|nr:hypothetical protein [Planctomycetota bacterium]